MTSRVAPVIALIGGDLPRAVVDERGATPLVLSADGTEASSASIQLLGATASRDVAALLATLMSGELDHVAGVVVSRESQDLLRLFYVLRMLERDRRLPWPVHLAEFLHTGGQSSLRYNEFQLGQLRGVIGDWLGSAARPVESAWERVATMYSVLEERRSSSQCSGAEFVECMQSVNRSPLIEAEQTVAAWNPAQARGRRTVMTGTRPWRARTHREVERRGWHVVAEDHAMGLLSTRLRPVDGHADGPGAAQSVLDWGPAAATATVEARVDFLVRLVKESRAEAVVRVVDPLDQAFPWEMSLQEERCSELGVDLIDLDLEEE